MAKITVDGVVIEYEQDDILEAVEILREDRAIASLGSMREQQAEIVAWIEEQKKGKAEEGNAGNADSGVGNSGGVGSQPSQSGEPTGIVDPAVSPIPEPPPVISPEEREKQKPPKRKSRWWGDAIPSE